MRLARRDKFAVPRGPNFSHVGVELGPHEVVWNGVLQRQQWAPVVARPRPLVVMPKGQQATRGSVVPGSLSDRLAAFVRGNPGVLLTSHAVADILGVDASTAAVVMLRASKRGLLQPAAAPAPPSRTGRPPVVYRAAVAS